MKNKFAWFTAGVTAAAAGYAIAAHRRIDRLEQVYWQKQQRAALDVLACPECRGVLTVVELVAGRGYHCPACQKDYPVAGGIPQFIQPEALTSWNKAFAGMYDWFSWGYRAFSMAAFAYIGMREDTARREITDRLDPKGGRVLEVSIGPGVNLPYLVARPDVGEIYGLDISPGQLSRCRAYVAQRSWDVQLQLGNAEHLPYLDNTFRGVFHLGGINFFNDKKAAIEEMIRVAKPGTRILICDENERGAQAYERFLPGFKQMAGESRQPIVPPVDLVPTGMQELRVFEAWNGWMYCIEFRKP